MADQAVVIPALPPEGDPHRLPKSRALEALDEYFRRRRKRIYLSAELRVGGGPPPCSISISRSMRGSCASSAVRLPCSMPNSSLRNSRA